MATTDDNKLRSLAAVLGIGSLALFGVTACDNGTDDTGDDAVEEEPAEDPMEEEDPAEDPAEEDPMEEDPAEDPADEEEDM